MTSNASGAMLMEQLPIARGHGGGLPPRATHSPQPQPCVSGPPLPMMRQPMNGDRRGVPAHVHPGGGPGMGGRPMLSGQVTPQHSGSAPHSGQPPLMMGPSVSHSGVGSGSPPMMMPHPPPPGTYGSPAGPRPVPPHMQNRGPPNAPHMPGVPMNGRPMSGGSGPAYRPRPQPPQQSPQQSPQQQHQQQMRRGQPVVSVARGPQPTSVQPTRLLDGRKIKDVERRQQQLAEAQREHQAFNGPTKDALKHRKENHQRRGDEVKEIKTTVGNDEAWVKGLTYSTWVESPKASLDTLDHDGPYKRQAGTRPAKDGKNRRKNRRDASHNSSSKSNSLIEALRNLFR
ncbi:hypothetical protein NESM_000483300 [Novymonas esmeraldas]|uniref:Uncharacterized protein n=1 Tax=Novymonas esmeraldas TaxID=1808958 RepID=A0AAW0EN47_9TRYP